MILEPTNRQYEAHYHLLYENEQHIAGYWLNCTSGTNNPLYLTVYGSINIMADNIMCTLVFTEPGVTLQDWISPNVVDQYYHSLTDTFRIMLVDIMQFIISNDSVYGNISSTNIYVAGNRIKFLKMCRLTNNVSQFVNMIRSFFPQAIHSELDVFLNYIEINHENWPIIKQSIKHPLLKSAQERMNYRLVDGNYVKEQPTATQTSVENGLVAKVSNWINEVAQAPQTHQGYVDCYQAMHFLTLQKFKNKVPLGLEAKPIGYSQSAVDFIRFNRNVAAHQNMCTKEIDSALNSYAPNFLAHLFEVLAPFAPPSVR
ncbi:hypothetical protein ACE6H2_018981 [Prunus campanulata]